MMIIAKMVLKMRNMESMSSLLSPMSKSAKAIGFVHVRESETTMLYHFNYI